MKILAYTSYYKPYISGVTVYLERILEDLEQHGAKVRVLTFKHSAGLRRKETHGGILVTRMPYFIRISKGFISPQSWWYFFTEARRSDRILVNLPNAEALLLMLFGKLWRKRIYAIYQCDVNLGRGPVARLIKLGLDASVSLQLALADRIIACPDYVEERTFYQQYKHKVLQTIPPIRTQPADRTYLTKLKSEKGNKRWIGFVGRIAREKGLEHLIDAVKMMDRDKYELVLAGPADAVGESKYRDAVLKKLDRAGVRHRMIESPSDTGLAAIYEALDVLVLPSVNQTEAFGMVQAEAMLHGTPCVATDLAGVRLPVTLTGAGEIVTPQDPLRLGEAIRRVLDKNMKRADIGKKAKEAFNPAKTYALYERLLLGEQKVAVGE